MHFGWSDTKQGAHHGLVKPYGNTDLFYIDQGNGLLPNCTQPLSEPMLTSENNFEESAQDTNP